MHTKRKERAKEDTGLGRASKGSDTWSPTEGNFCDMVINIINNAFLHYLSAPTVRLCSMADNIPIGSEEERFLSSLPAGHDAFVLKWNCGSQPHEDTTYGHAVCVRKHPVTKEWYLLNFEIGHPMKLTSIDWHLLKGSVYIQRGVHMAKISCGMQLMKATHRCVTSDKSVITQEATSHARISQHPRQQQQCIRLDLEPEHAAGQTSEPKLPNNAPSGHAKIACGKRLYRRTKNMDSTALTPTRQQGHAAQNASNDAKLPDNASRRHGKITCGKRL